MVLGLWAQVLGLWPFAFGLGLSFVVVEFSFFTFQFLIFNALSCYALTRSGYCCVCLLLFIANPVNYD